MNSRRKALVLIDDEKAYIDLLAQLLSENLGCEVITFTRPREALAAMPSLAVGCVVTDFHMPEMNGYELIRRGSVLLPGIPFIMISGHAVHLFDDQPDWPPAMCALLPKPFSWRVLTQYIAQYAPDFVVSLASADASRTPA